MSRENVKLVRRSYEDERYLAPDAAVYRGHEGVRRWAQGGADAVPSPRFEVLRWFDGGDAVVTDVVVHVRGAASGLDTRARLAHAIRIRDGKGVSIGSFRTVEEALAAVGLRE